MRNNVDEVNKNEKGNLSPVGNRTSHICGVYNSSKIHYTNIRLACNTTACGGNCSDNCRWT